MKSINLSDDLKLHIDIAGEAIGILATRGAGKSFTSADLAEELWDVRTFDSYATPKPGQVKVEPKKLAQIDLNRLGKEIQATAERAKDNYPKALHARIRDLEKRLAAEKQSLAPAVKVEIKEVPVITDKQIKALLLCYDRLQAEMDRHGNTMIKMIGDITEHCKILKNAITKISVPRMTTHHGQPEYKIYMKPSAKNKGILDVKITPHKPIQPPSEGLSGPEQCILDAIAWLESANIQPPYSRVQVAFIAGYKPGGGAFMNPLGKLRTTGLVSYPSGGMVELTEQGRSLACKPPEVLVPEELQRRVIERLNGPQQKILQKILDIYPESISKTELADAAGYAPDGGAFLNPLGSLRSLGLIGYPQTGRVVALPVLFLE